MAKSNDKERKSDDFKSVRNAIRNNPLEKVYIIYGEEAYLRDKVIDEIVDVIKEHDSVYFTELGTFGVKFKEAHESRNPATGETINVEAKYVPDFKFGSQIKNALKGVGVDAD